MDKLDLEIVVESCSKLRVSFDHGEWDIVPLTAPVERMLNALKNPDKYNVIIEDAE